MSNKFYQRQSDSRSTITQLIKLLEKNQDHQLFTQSFDLNNYLGTSKKLLWIKVPIKTKIARAWNKQNNNIAVEEFQAILDHLFLSDVHDHYILGCKLIETNNRIKSQLNLEKIEEWLSLATGWAEVDAFCQATSSAQLFLHHWTIWSNNLIKFSQSNNFSLKRGSLVMLIKPVKQSDDVRFAQLALNNVDRLKSENSILITKAISWLLREMLKNHHDLIEKYLQSNHKRLPKIAVREVKSKMENLSRTASATTPTSTATTGSSAG